MLFHLLYNGMLIGVPLLAGFGYTDETLYLQEIFHPAVTVVFALLACLLLATLGHRLSTRSADSAGRLEIDLDKPPTKTMA